MKCWMKIRLSLAFILGVCLVCAAMAADWPQWRGPDRNGISKETGLLKHWPQEGPKLLWQVSNIDDGYSTPSVVGERIYLSSSKDMDDEYVQALDVKDGKRIWATKLGKVGPNQIANYPTSRSTPTVDGESLYILGSDGDLVCVKVADGKEVWRKNLRTDFGGIPGMWAYSESPLVDGDLLVCTPGGADATLVALDKKKGTLVWKSAVPGGDKAAYASIIVVQAAGIKQYVQFLEKGVVGVDAKTGKFLWRYDQTGKGMANMATPVAHNGEIYTSAGRAGFGGLVRLKATKDGVAAEQVYYERDLPTSLGGSVEIGGYLYGTNGEGLVCAEFATGKIKWHNKSIGTGSVCCADGRFYLHGENGDVALVEVTPDAYREHGRFTPPGRAQASAWCHGKGLGLSRGRQWPALFTRPQCSVVLRREGSKD